MVEWQREIVHEIARKLRETEREFKYERLNLDEAVVIGDFNHDDWEGDLFMGFKMIHAPTIGSYTLGNVDYKVARFFEDA